MHDEPVTMYANLAYGLWHLALFTVDVLISVAWDKACSAAATTRATQVSRAQWGRVQALRHGQGTGGAAEGAGAVPRATHVPRSGVQVLALVRAALGSLRECFGDGSPGTPARQQVWRW
jgi:hypothetical protein